MRQQKRQKPNECEYNKPLRTNKKKKMWRVDLRYVGNRKPVMGRMNWLFGTLYSKEWEPHGRYRTEKAAIESARVMSNKTDPFIGGLMWESRVVYDDNTRR